LASIVSAISVVLSFQLRAGFDAQPVPDAGALA
jgi:hypothetical protein